MPLHKDPAYQEYLGRRQRHWDRVALRMASWKGWGGAYHQRLQHVYRHIVPPNLRILEIGCGEGDLLASLQPLVGVGVDLSQSMLAIARSKHPALRLLQSDAHHLPLRGTFDVIILSDLISELWDVQAVFHELRRLCHPYTRILINSYSRLWELPLRIVELAGLAKPSLDLNWLTVEDVRNLLKLEGFEHIREWQEILLPLPIPILEPIFNRVLVRLWPFRHLALTNMIAARPAPAPSSHAEQPTVSVIIPARNEAGNIADIFRRTPDMGAGTELVFVEGHSRDDTYAAIKREIKGHPERRCKLLQQSGEGKGDAVRLGFKHASGQILLILDADLTVPPEDLPRFYHALVSGKAEFVNGVRLVYPLEEQAMRYLNLIGNKFFGLAFSWLLGQPIKDTLCGTKGLWKHHYELIAANRRFFGNLDPFGDFDLLLGAARFNLKIVDLPIRYRKRTYGETNIHRWRHGLLLLRMLILAARRLKFV